MISFKTWPHETTQYSLRTPATNRENLPFMLSSANRMVIKTNRQRDRDRDRERSYKRLL